MRSQILTRDRWDHHYYSQGFFGASKLRCDSDCGEQIARDAGDDKPVKEPPPPDDEPVREPPPDDKPVGSHPVVA